MTLDRLTQITESGIKSGITLTDTNLVGVITASSLTVNGPVNISGQVTASEFIGNVNSVGISTFSGGIQGNVTGDLTGNVNSTGVSTFTTLNTTSKIVVNNIESDVGVSTVTFGSDISTSGTVFGSGSVIKVGFGTDPGSTTNSTSIINANGSFINFTPKRNDSIIYITASFRATAQNLASTNVSSYHTISESGRDLGFIYQNRAFSGTGGIGCESPATIQVAVASTGTTIRSFHNRHRTDNASAFAGTQSIHMTFVEVES